MHKIRNFAEDLSLHLKDLGTLPTAEADRTTDTVVVSGIHARQLRRCRLHIEKFLEKHFLTQVCESLSKMDARTGEGPLDFGNRTPAKQS